MTTDDANEKALSQQEIFSLSIYETLDKAQNTHGVMHEDYHQYRQYCTNRLYRLRHAKPVRRDLVHNSKYVEGVQMRRNAYCPRNHNTKNQTKEDDDNENEDDAAETETDVIIDHENHLWVPFFQAERTWAQACEVQKQKRANKTQQLVLRKLRKSVKFATTLEEMSAKTCTEQTQQEIQSYLGWMKGNYALQKQDYATALEAYRASMSILLTLAHKQQEKGLDDPQSLVLADLWATRAESVLRPLVRFCQYECKDTTPDLAMETKQAASAKTSAEIVIHVRGKDIPLDSYKDLCVLYLKAEALQKPQEGSSNNNDSSFLSLLSIYDDAIAVIENELAQYQSIQAGPAVNAKKEELTALTGYFQYQKLYKSLQKNQERLKDCHSDAERVHVYDALLQNAQAMAQVGVGGGGSEEEEAQAHVLRIRALRCCALAKVYLGSLQRPIQAKALWIQAQTLTKRAMEELAACDTRDKEHEVEIENYLEELEELKAKDLAGLEVRLKAALYLRKSGTSSGFTTGTDRPLWMRLEEFDPGTSGGPLVDNPPKAIPIPCKPVFYDIAWKYAGGNFPIDQLEEEIEKRQPKMSSSGGGGIFGWLTG